MGMVLMNRPHHDLSQTSLESTFRRLPCGPCQGSRETVQPLRDAQSPHTCESPQAVGNCPQVRRGLVLLREDSSPLRKRNRCLSVILKLARFPRFHPRTEISALHSPGFPPETPFRVGYIYDAPV